MKKVSLLIIIGLLSFSMAYAEVNGDKLKEELKSGLEVTGGVTYFSVAGDDEDDDAESIMGLTFGAESTLASGLIVGLSYTQKGYGWSSSESEEDGYRIEYTSEGSFSLSYLAGHVFYPVPMSDKLTILAGGEAGLFYKGKFEDEWEYKATYNGETIEEDSDSDSDTIDRDDWDDEDGAGLDYGALVGVKYKVTPEASVVLTYYHGLIDLADDWEVANRGFNLYVSYKF